MKVRLGSPLRSYTAGATVVEADGSTLAELVRDLDRRYPGIAFRIVDEQSRVRQHVTVWIHSERCRDAKEWNQRQASGGFHFDGAS